MFPYTNLNRQPLSEMSCFKSYSTNGLIYKPLTDSFKTTIVSFVDWKTVPNPIQAAELYSQSVLKVHASEKPLYLHVDLTSSISDQEASLIAFYKACNVNWACPLKTRLKGVFYSSFLNIFCGENRLHEVHKNSNYNIFFFLGDPAIGEGVNRFLFSMTTQKLKCGFHLNLGIPTLRQCPSQQCLNLVSFSV